ncbi:hypothetical protein [Streptomyces lunalinharesii]|uniref:Uncharacterized protein n=1 Tax=Streptomyces lunalinharesii TaxID=333384 RepID=A0ABP6FJW2_9ACTN
MGKILHIKTLTCDEQEDWTGYDRIVLYVNGEAVNGAAFKTHQGRFMGDKVPFKHEAVVKLVEIDDLDPDDVLGVHTIRSGSSIVEFARGDARYRMSYEVLQG